MKKKIPYFVYSCLLLQQGSVLAGDNQNVPTRVSQIERISFSGHFFAGGGYLHQQVSPSDGDLQYGTIVGVVKQNPPIQLASLQKITTKYEAALKLLIGYQFDNSNYDITGNYFHFKHNFYDSAQIPSNNFIFQSYLGNSYRTGQAYSAIRLNQFDVNIGSHLIVGGNLYLHPYLGIDYASLDSEFQSSYQDPILNPMQSGQTVGRTNSQFRGIGPILGLNFNYPLTQALSLSGFFNGALFLGKLNYSLRSFSQLANMVTPYNPPSQDGSKLAGSLATSLAVQYYYLINNSDYAAQLSAGYEISDFINMVGRTYPLNGFANNPAGSNPISYNILSSRSFNGPFVKVSLVGKDMANLSTNSTNSPFVRGMVKPGWFVSLTNLAVKPQGQRLDTIYAVVVSPNSNNYSVYPETKFHWAGSLSLGYIFSDSNTDVQLSYLNLKTDDTDKLNPGGPHISSVSANGPVNAVTPIDNEPLILFSNAKSELSYKVHQIDLTAGKYFLREAGNLERGFIGLSIAKIKRTQDKAYTGGIPGNITSSKYTFLLSEFRGIGPEFGYEGHRLLTERFGLESHFSGALLIGDIKSSLKQTEISNRDFVENFDLTAGNQRFVIPSGQAKIGARFSQTLQNGLNLFISGGYQITYYYKAINLLYPTFRTGLEQTNSSFYFHGPYLTLTVNGAPLS